MRLIHILLALSCFFSTAASAAVTQFLTAIAEINPPFVYINNAGVVTGVEVENIRNIARRLGYEVIFTTVNNGTAMDSAGANEYDFAFNTTRTLVDDGFFYYTKPTFKLKTVFYKRKKDNISFGVLKSLSPYTIGMTYEFQYPNDLQYLFDYGILNAHVLYGQNVALLGLLKVATKQLDLFACLKPYCGYEIKKNKAIFRELNHVDFIEREAGEALQVGLAFSKLQFGAKALRDKFDIAIQNYLGTQEHITVLRKYGVE